MGRIRDGPHWAKLLVAWILIASFAVTVAFMLVDVPLVPTAVVSSTAIESARLVGMNYVQNTTLTDLLLLGVVLGPLCLFGVLFMKTASTASLNDDGSHRRLSFWSLGVAYLDEPISGGKPLSARLTDTLTSIYARIRALFDVGSHFVRRQFGLPLLL